MSSDNQQAAPQKPSGSRAASGRSFLIIIVLATVAALVVTIWTFHSAGKAAGANGAAAAGFKI
jgi:flagellar basal body-associated protein FliL